jgi:hypothetical protein
MRAVSQGRLGPPGVRQSLIHTAAVKPGYRALIQAAAGMVGNLAMQ